MIFHAKLTIFELQFAFDHYIPRDQIIRNIPQIYIPSEDAFFFELTWRILTIHPVFTKNGGKDKQNMDFLNRRMLCTLATWKSITVRTPLRSKIHLKNLLHFCSEICFTLYSFFVRLSNWNFLMKNVSLISV